MPTSAAAAPLTSGVATAKANAVAARTMVALSRTGSPPRSFPQFPRPGRRDVSNDPRDHPCSANAARLHGPSLMGRD